MVAYVYTSVSCPWIGTKTTASVIKKSEHYSIQGILVVQDKGREVAADIGKVYYC